jgi:hypothetical protein
LLGQTIDKLDLFRRERSASDSRQSRHQRLHDPSSL